MTSPASLPSLRPRLRTALSLALTLLTATVALPAQQPAQQPAPQHSFTLSGDHFLLDGQPFQVISGEMHYARIPRAYWKQRMDMARAMGVNTIATYVFWNVHEPKPGVYDFSGNNDLVAFLKLAQQEHLYVLLRAGPYSCAEWEFGGFPAWLLQDPRMATALRSNDPAFMVPAERWIRRLAQEVAPLQIGNGGPIIATQIENEYGNFGSDAAYMEHWHQIFLSAGFTQSLLYTVDPSKALARGSIPGVFSGVNFGTGSAERGLDAAAALRPGQPLFATEYWPGWFDLWGHPHQTRPIAPQLKDLDTIFRRHGSVNIYMVHGGTSFGMMAGASQSTGAYRGNVTSYDYDAPIDEAGHPTPKFFAYRDLILHYTHLKPLPVPATPPVIAVAPFALTTTTSLWDHLPAPVTSPEPVTPELPTMEQLGQAYGYILYRIQLPHALTAAVLKLDHPYDYVQVYLDRRLAGTLDRHYHQTSLHLTTIGPAQLDILVENTGRLNSTKGMRDERKGIRGATLDGQPLTGWQIFSLPMSQQPEPTAAANSPANSNAALGPHFAFGTFTLTQLGDTFLDVRQLGKGVLWINGHCLGRFWNIGPQGTLYLPGPWLHVGSNQVAIFELDPAPRAPVLAGLTRPILDAPTPTYDNDPERTKQLAPDAEFGPQLAAPASPSPQP